ncbi:hypothetical protein FRC05_003956 [Tulasnella sp. 425]|nr:hypothetical protein FRC05_003956 [Tulasnella sp. 425]
MHTVVERMAKLSSVIGLAASPSGQVKLEIGTEVVGVETARKNCQIPEINGMEATAMRSTQVFGLRQLPFV